MQEDSTLLEEEGSDGVGSHSPFQRNFVDTSLFELLYSPLHRHIYTTLSSQAE